MQLHVPSYLSELCQLSLQSVVTNASCLLPLLLAADCYRQKLDITKLTDRGSRCDSLEV